MPTLTLQIKADAKYLLLVNGPCPKFITVVNEELQAINSTLSLLMLSFLKCYS